MAQDPCEGCPWMPFSRAPKITPYGNTAEVVLCARRYDCEKFDKMLEYRQGSLDDIELVDGCRFCTLMGKWEQCDYQGKR